MTLREEFESTGAWLFRWRSYLPFLFSVVYILALRNFKYLGHDEELDKLWEILCLLISFFGLGIRIVTVGYAPKGTSGRNTTKQKADTLNTTGIYSVVRHPLYLGNFFMGLGVSFFAHSWWLIIMYILAFLVYYERIMFAEEAYLSNKFGDEYLQWAKSAPTFIPSFKQWERPHIPFSLRIVLKKEYNSFFAVIIILFISEVIGDMFAKGKIELDFMWAVLVGFSFFIWITILLLKKKTKLLHVESR